MAISRKVATASVAAAALAAALVGAQNASAEPITGGCSGGHVSFSTTPLGMSAAPTTGTWTGNLTGCTGTPASNGTLSGTFNGTGSCADVNGQIDGTVSWSNGAISRISGPWHVPGGGDATNTVTITDGAGARGLLAIEEGPISNAAAMVVPCLMGQARNADVPIMAAHFS